MRIQRLATAAVCLWLALPGAQAVEKAAEQAVDKTAGQARARVFKSTCYLAKTAADDPIVFPNQPGAAHLHDFYGNKGVDADTASTEDLLRFASNCGTGDHSSYWTPSVFRNGAKLDPYSVKIYYENRSLAAGPLQPFPPGFRYVLGNPKASSAADTERYWTWSCEDASGFGDEPPARCDTPFIQLRSEFPNCWDGKLEANGNAAGHVAWAHGLATPGQGLPMVRDAANNTCPAAFPIALPMLRIVIKYRTGVDTGRINFAQSPDRCSAPDPNATASVAGAQATKQGSVYAKHGDFFNGWDAKTLKAIVDRCLNDGNANCEERKKAARLPMLPLAGAGVQFGGFPAWVAHKVAHQVAWAARTAKRLAQGPQAATLARRDDDTPPSAR